MQDSNVPTKIVLPWGASAGSPYIGTIPVASQIGITANAASLTDGFPPMTDQAGGAPRIQDFNGIINLMTAWNRWQAAGGPLYYDSAFSSAIGGYPNGAVLSSISTVGNFWISTVDNNTSNPDTGGANWLGATIVPSGRLLNVQVLSGASGTYTATAGTNSIIFEAVGAGGAGGGVIALTGSNYGVGAGGGSGTYLKGIISSGFSGSAWATGVGGTGTTATGGNGGTTAFGSFFSIPGGTGGGTVVSSASTAAYATGGNGGGPATIGGGVTQILQISGISSVANAFVLGSAQLYVTGYGGSNPLGTGGGPGAPANGTGYGSGGGGRSCTPGNGPFTGGAGKQGVIIIYEFS